MTTKKHVAFLSVVLLASGIAVPANAMFVDALVGNSAFLPGSFGGWVNFAVYDNPTGANWVTDLGAPVAVGLPGSSFTGFERNVFFYQIVRDGSGPAEDMTALTIPPGSDPWTGGGALAGAVFDDGAPVLAGGPNPTIGPPAAAPGLSNTTGSLDATPFLPDGMTNAPVAMSVPAGAFAWIPFTFGEDEHSPVLFLTSDSQPLDVNGVNPATGLPNGTNFTMATTAGFPTAAGPLVNVPVSNPEPGSMVLVAVGLVGAGAVGRWQKRRKDKAKREGINDSTVSAI